MCEASRHQIARLAAADLEYQPSPAAQRMRGGATGLVGCVVGAMNRGFLGTIYEGVERVLSARGYSMVVASAHGDTGCSADQRESKTFCQQLPHQPRSSTAESHAYGELAASLRGACEREIRYVRARNQKQHRSRAEQQPQRLPRPA